VKIGPTVELNAIQRIQTRNPAVARKANCTEYDVGSLVHGYCRRANCCGSIVHSMLLIYSADERLWFKRWAV